VTAIEPTRGRKSGPGSAGVTSDATAPATMRALVQHSYGAPEVLRTAMVALPTPGPGQVRIRVGASSVNARDWHVMRGEPRLARLLDRRIFGLRAPRIVVRGTDVAGVIDAVGLDVTRWQPGDRVFGEADGAWAEQVIAAQDAIAAVPVAMSLQHAAALPLAATTALTCLSAGHPQAGDRLLINGASGGVGTFAVQMAHAKGLHITAVCSARNADLARSLGANTVVDYALEDFCGRPDRYDMVLDLVGNRPVGALRNLLRPTGVLVLSGGGVPGTGRYVGPLALLVRAQLLARRAGPRIAVPQAQPTTERLEEIAALVQSGSLVPVIDRVFALDDGAEAVRYVETEHASGKVIVTVLAT
jgi:NADPH:quinone reductase-like Zn-dependent oxidoreductase